MNKLFSTKSTTGIEEKMARITPKYYFIVSGVLAAFLAFLGFSFLGMLGTGTNIVLISDGLYQYAPVLSQTAESIRNNENIWYSFSPLLGSNMAYLLMFICWSPFNLLYIVLGFLDVETITQIVIILKISFIAMAFTFFAQKVMRNKGPESIFFSLCYAFGGYTVCYGIVNFMFLDSLILLPLVLVSTIESFRNNRKYYWVVVSYAFLFVTNFHLGYSIGLYTLLFVLLYLFVCQSEQKAGHRALLFVKWAGCVCVAILISMFFLLPGILQFFASGYEDGIENLNTGVTILNLLNTMFFGMYEDIGMNNSMLYSGLPVLLLCPLFFFDGTNGKKDKLFWGMLIGISLICMSIDPIYYALCAFDYPDGFNFRFGFAVSFSLCAVATKECANLKQISLKKIIINVISIILFFGVMIGVQILQKKGMTNTLGLWAVNGIIIAVWVGAYFMLTRSKMSGLSKFSLATILVLAELILFAYTVLPEFSDKRYFYEDYVYDYESVAEELAVSDPSFYRVIVVGDEYYNSSLGYDTNGIGIFATCRNEKTANALNGLGFANSLKYTSSSGYTPVTQMILGIKYLIYDVGSNFGLSDTKTYSTVMNPQTLNIGFMVDEGIEDYTFETRNVFENSNGLLKQMTGENKDVFVLSDEYEVNNYGLYLEKKDGAVEIGKENVSGGGLEISLPKSEDYDAAYLQFETDKSLYYDEDRYFVSGGDNIYNMGVQLYLSQANEMHYFSSEDRYILTLKADEEAYDKYVIQDVNVAYFSKNTLEYYYDILSKEQLNVEEWKDGYIKGHVNVDSGKTVLFLSVPYEKGWSVNVNGVKTDTFAVVDGAFTAVELPGNGSYDIEMKFVCPGVKEGLLISAIGVIITVLMILWERKREKSEAIKR